MKKILILIVLICEFVVVFAEKPFTGSFLMSFKLTETGTDWPMKWSIENISSGGKMGLEVQDDMIKEGVSRRVIFNPRDSTWTMLIGFNAVKQGTRIHAADMYKDTVKREKINLITTREKRKIENYNCKKIIIETSKNISEVWITDQLNFDICNIYKLLVHCGMLSKYVKRGDWYWAKNIKGMILEVTTRKKTTGESYTMNITSLKPGETNSVLFETSGYRISDIPEGQNCGTVVED